MRSSITASVLSLVVASGCAPAADVDAVTEVQQAETVMHSYTVRINNYWVTRPRSKNTDSNWAVLGAWEHDQVNYPYDHAQRAHQFVGNVGHDSGHDLDFALSFTATNDQVVKIAAGIENAGSGDPATFEWELTNAVWNREAALSELGVGPVWPVDSSFTKGVGNWHGNGWTLCDGVVAADGIALYGSALESLTNAGPYTRTEMFPGTDSANGCGANSLYYMTWTVQRDW